MDGRLLLCASLAWVLAACASDGPDPMSADEIVDRLDSELQTTEPSEGVDEYYSNLLQDSFAVDDLVIRLPDSPVFLDGGFILVATDGDGFDQKRQRELTDAVHEWFDAPGGTDILFRGDVAVVVVGEGPAGERVREVVGG